MVEPHDPTWVDWHDNAEGGVTGWGNDFSYLARYDKDSIWAIQRRTREVPSLPIP